MTLTISVKDARPSPHAASPSISFRLRVEETSGVSVHAIVLRCHTRIEPRGRAYSREEKARLYELFGDVSQWDRTLRPVTLATTTLAVPSFEHQLDVDLAVPCTYDLEVASAKYLHAVRDGDIPLVFLFSGSIFCGNVGLRVEPVSWDLEASYRLPVPIWRATMDQFFPGGGWLRLQRETIDRLMTFRGRLAVVTWDEAIDRLLERLPVEEIAG